MNCYTTHKTSRITTVILTIPILILALMAITLVILDGNILALLFGAVLLYISRYLLAQNFVTVCLDEDVFVIKRVFYKREEHRYLDIQELVLVSYQKRKKFATGLGVEHQAGKVLGHTLVHITENANTNSHYRKSLAIRFKNHTVTTLNSNYIINGNVLLEELSKRSQVTAKEIPVQSFRDWKREEFRTDM